MLTHIYISDYKTKKTNILSIAKAHLKGWSYNDWMILGINDSNRKKYLSTRDYCSMHPFNGVYSAWIDDKLILKYILYGTAAGQYMPEYYFHIMENGIIISLMDVNEKYKYKNFEGVADLLLEKKTLAFKLNKGSLGKGFYKAEYKDGSYYLNESKYTKDGFLSAIMQMKDYLVTEYLFPHPEFAKFCCKSVGCLRYVIGRNDDGSLYPIYSFIRFGTSKSKFVENYNSGGVLCIVKDGTFENGNVLDFSKCKNQIIEKHPDNNVLLRGGIPYWKDVVKAAYVIADAMPQLCYMGIDFCITNDNRVKIIEINSLTSLDSLQTDCSILDTKGGTFFFERLIHSNKKNK